MQVKISKRSSTSGNDRLEANIRRGSEATRFPFHDNRPANSIYEELSSPIDARNPGKRLQCSVIAMKGLVHTEPGPFSEAFLRSARRRKRSENQFSKRRLLNKHKTRVERKRFNDSREPYGRNKLSCNASRPAVLVVRYSRVRNIRTCDL